MTINKLTDKQFTKEQLIEHITRHSDEISRLIKQQSRHDNEYRKKLLAVNEIALAVLIAEPVLYCMDGGGLDSESVSSSKAVVDAWVKEWNEVEGGKVYKTVALHRLPEID